jgi:hypothetical protein
MTISQNDDSVYVYLNGSLVYSRGISSATQSFTMNLPAGNHLLQVILNNSGSNLSHLQTSGDIVDGTDVILNAGWGSSVIADASFAVKQEQEEIARKKAEEAARKAEKERARQEQLARLRKTDPVAQSFETNSVVNISSVTIELTELPTKDLTCKVVETTAGIPDIRKLIAYGRLPLASLKLGDNKVVFDSIAQLKQDTEYAFIIITESYEGQVAIAKVGDKTSDGQYLKYQTNTGVMFLSVNENTWTPVQDTDLKFVLNKVEYNTNRNIKLGTITSDERLEDLTDFRLVGNTAIPADCDVKFYMMINGSRYDIVLNKTVYLPQVKKSLGPIDIYADLSTVNSVYTPTIKEGLVLLAGKAYTPGFYTTRQFEVRDGLVTPAKLQVFLDQIAETNTTIEVAYQSGPTDEDWTTMTRVTKNDRSLGDNWIETCYESPSVSIGATRIRIKLATSHYENRPSVKNIRILTI